VAYDLTTTAPTEKWLACRYGDLALAQRLPDDMKSCVVRYTEQREYPGSYDMKATCSTVIGILRPISQQATPCCNIRRVS
jgi:hypothetical protein